MQYEMFTSFVNKFNAIVHVTLSFLSLQRKYQKVRYLRHSIPMKWHPIAVFIKSEAGIVKLTVQFLIHQNTIYSQTV